MTENTEMHLLVTDTFQKKLEAWIRKPVSIWCDHHLPHGDMSGVYAGHTFSFQELCTDPCDMEPCITMLKHEVMAVSLCFQIAIDKMQLCSLSVTSAWHHGAPCSQH